MLKASTHCIKVKEISLRTCYLFSPTVGKSFFTSQQGIRFFASSSSQLQPVITEIVNGRQRIYASLQAIATKSQSNSTLEPTFFSSTSSITSTPLSWKWIEPITEDKKSKKSSVAWYSSGSKDASKSINSRSSSRLFGVVHSLKQNLREMFLPIGYPEAVHGCYRKFHIWLFLETYAGSAIGVLCSQAMLASLGLGEMEAAGGAVAIQWVLKDGIGEVGKLFFIKRYASTFDSHPKTWKFAGESIAIVGAFLQLCTCISLPKFFLPLAAAGNTFGLIHASIWFASHMSFTKHLSANGNIGDIVAKDDAQMSTANLLGMITGVGLISMSHSPVFLFAVFTAFSPLKLWATSKMLHSAEFEILNQANLTLLCREFIDSENVLSYNALKNREIGFGEWIRPSYKKGNVSFKIKMGSTVDQSFESSEQVERALHVLKNEKYLLNYHHNTMWILYHQNSNTEDIIKSILHALKFHDVLQRKDCKLYGKLNILEQTLDWTNDNYSRFSVGLDEKSWKRDSIYWDDSGMRIDWKDNNESREI